MIERISPHVESIDSEPLLRLSAVLAERMGLDFSRGRLADLERGILAAAPELGFTGPGECLRRLTSAQITREQLEVLASHLTVGETYFFREPKSLEAFRTRVLPALTAARGYGEQRIRIWSAGCATGEEPYSIAILLDSLLSDPGEQAATVLATDINPRFLDKAKSGVYSEWSFRGTPHWVRERYFNKNMTGNGFAVLPRIREMVTFEYHNLVEDPYPSLLNGTNAMDIIFCSNVLMYFSPARARDVVENLRHSLMDGGWLIVSPVETSQTLFSRFEAVHADGVTLYRKGSAPTYRVPALPAERTAPSPEPAESIKEIPATLPTRRIASLFPAVRPGVVKQAKEQGVYEQARKLYEQGLYAEAAAMILAQKEKSGHEADVRETVLLARSLANQGRLNDALLWCEKAIGSDKLTPSPYYLAATILQEQGLFDKAATLLKQAIYLDRKFVLAHFALGVLMQRQGRMGDSGKHFEIARALLRTHGHDDVLPESDGMIAGRLMEIIERLTR